MNTITASSMQAWEGLQLALLQASCLIEPHGQVCSMNEMKPVEHNLPSFHQFVTEWNKIKRVQICK